MPPTLAEIDEALMHASLVPETERGTAWHAYTNALLEQRRANTPPHQKTPTTPHHPTPQHATHT